LSTPTSAPPVDPAISRGVGAYGLFMLTRVYAFNFTDWQIRVTLRQPIKLEMGLSDARLGLLSDFYIADFGDDSLRYAMLTVVVLGAPAAVVFLLAARYLPANLARRSG
jgi:hypothetical protein